MTNTVEPVPDPAGAGANSSRIGAAAVDADGGRPRSARDRLFGTLQHGLPQHAISRAILRLTRSRRPRVKDALIRGFLRLYDVDLSDAERPIATDYESFNAFFTRALRRDARPLPADPAVIVSPVDGTISEIGAIEGSRLLQAKGRWYSLEALLAARRPWVERFAGGRFATIYLAPYDYHRMHMAADGTLAEGWYVPGRLFSVNASTARSVESLFARNERIVLTFRDGAIEHAIVLVGALNVGCMETVWHGVVTPRSRRSVESLVLPRPSPSPALARGVELGRFNMGSTVILLFPPGSVEWLPQLRSGTRLRMGEPIGQRV